jgi:Tat protein secretion system quality control protein TatD with DNase activity
MGMGGLPRNSEGGRRQEGGFHWFSGPTKVLKGLLKENYFRSATPAAAYSRDHRRVIQTTPLDSLLLETDSPVKCRGEISEPVHIIKSLKAVAELKGVDKETVASRTTGNAKTYLKYEEPSLLSYIFTFRIEFHLVRTVRSRIATSAIKENRDRKT